MPGALVALIARQALDEGPTCTSWPGLLFYRFEQRISTHWDEVSDEMNRLVPKELRIEPTPPMPDVYVRVLDLSLVKAIQRFLIALVSESDRSVLAPIYLREIVYWILRSEQRMWLKGSFAHEISGSAIPAVISFMKEKMDQSLTVRDLAETVCMSESSFAHLFKTTVGVSPLQFLKRMRLEHARESLLSGSNVRKAANNVSYTSVSHFSSQFKRHFGESPKTYTKSSEICVWMQ